MATMQTRPRKDGTNTYRVIWRDAGTVRGQSFTDKDKAIELKNFLDANGNSFAVAAKAKRKKDNTAPTVSEVVTRHIDLLRKPQPGTISKYRRMAASHIHGTDFGDMPVDRVDVAAVNAWFDNLKVSSGANQEPGKPLARKTKQTVQAIVSAAFKRASDDGLMRGNPARGVADADLNEAREPVYLSIEDLELIASSVPAHYQLFIRTLGKTGLRYSEATALRKRDVRVKDKRCTLVISRAWKSIGGGEEIGPPKTKKARRGVLCSMELSADLIEHMKDLALDDLVFTRPNGMYLRNAIFHKEVWQPTIKALVASGKLDRAPWIHEIRHAHTTHLLEKRIPIQDVQERLGHEDPQTTLRVYARVSSRGGIAAADALG